MKYALLFATTAALALGACNKPEAGNNVAEAPAANNAAEVSEAPANAANAAAPAAAGTTAAFTVGQAPTKEFMVGTWGEGDACELPIKFEADGTIKDGPFEKWDIKDGHLVMEGSPQKMKLTVVDANTMDSTIEGKTAPHKIKRCGA